MGIISKTTNHSLSAVQYTRCAEKYRNSHRVRRLDILGKTEKEESDRAAASTEQSGKAQISMRDLTFLDDGDEHMASSNGDDDRRPDH